MPSVAGWALLALLFGALGLFVIERARRRTLTAQPAARSLRIDLGFVLLSPVTELVSRSLTSLGMIACALVAGAHVGPNLVEGFGPVVAQPRWLIVIEMLVLGDFLYYWTHRLAHTVPWLWRLHAVHHSTEHMRWTSAMRAHPAEVYTQLLHTLPLFALGFPIDALAPLAPISLGYALLIHTNLDLSLRRVSYLFNSPLFHRWHHAREVTGIGTNFAGLFPIFDVLFGTYHLPHHAPAALGVEGLEIPESFHGQLLFPFQPAPRTTTATATAEVASTRRPPRRASVTPARTLRPAVGLLQLGGAAAHEL